MAWIRTIEPDVAKGALAAEYAKAKARAGRVFNIVRIMSLDAEHLRGGIDFYVALMRNPSPLDRRLREMLAVVVSQTNHCHY